MKKLIVAAAIVCAAVISQAASVYWTCKDVEKITDVSASGIAFFVNAATLDHDSVLALAGKGAAAVSDALSGAYQFAGSDGNYGIAKASAVANATLGLEDGKDYNVYLVLFDTAEITDASNFYVTEVKELPTLAGAEDVSQVKWGSQSAVGNWNAVGAVPEPTSGLLLLLGMAGLALRRKQK